MKRFPATLALAVLITASSCAGGGTIPSTAPNPGTSQPPSGPAPDDWTTYAHDAARTGYETASTGITTSTVSSLRLAWRNTPDPACASQAQSMTLIADEASPLAANGYVYYADECGYVAALARDTGNVVWHTRLATATALAGPQGTPTLDAARNLLIVPVHGTNGGTASGGYLAALNAQTGSIVWQQAPLASGNLRGEPLAVNGVVFEGLAGGDSDTGYVQGGMFAVDETTGRLVGNLPFFQVAPVGAADDGGGAWSPISYDGRYLYFGTGNTKNEDGYQDSVVQMDPATTASSPNFSAATWDNQLVNGANDEDVGGGELLWGGNLYFESKSGVFYGYSLANPSVPFVRVQVNASGRPGSGAIWTPTTDGNVVAVSSGYNTFSPQPFSSTLDVFTLGGSAVRCQLQATNSPLYSYAAFVKGVGFTVLDNGVPTGSGDAAPAFVAFDDNCNVLWRAAASDLLAYFYAGPVIVPSGVYAVDDMGNVYAWKLASGTAAAAASLRRALIRPGVRSNIRLTPYARRETRSR
jgi:hypothetical protein